MRFVHGKQADPHLLERASKRVVLKSLWRDVKQLQVAAHSPVDTTPLNLKRHRAIDDGCGHTEFVQVINLVFHECDQRRNHKRDAFPRQRRQLIAQRLSASGRHDAKNVLAGHDKVDDLSLRGPEVVEAE